jgi:hypothetical protein
MEQELLQTVATLTTRSENFVDLMRDRGSGPRGRFHVLDAITIA